MKILMVMTSHGKLGDTGKKTGFAKSIERHALRRKQAKTAG